MYWEAEAKSVLRIFWLIVLCGFTLASSRANAATAVAVDLGIGVGGPGEEASVPVTLSVGETGQVGKISLAISWPTASASFLKAMADGQTTALPISVSARPLNNENNQDETILDIEISAPTPIPKGEVVQLIFQVSKEAQLNDEIQLKNLKQAVQTIQGETLAASGADGLITVIGEVIFACFFYMH